MAKSKTIRVTEEELAAIQELRRQQGEQVYSEPVAVDEKEVIATDAQNALANALATAIERTQPPRKKTQHTPRTPWSPPPGVPRTKMKRKMYQHGLLITNRVTNETIDLLNQIRPGVYCDGWVRVNLRKDRGLDITYPVRTNAQRLRLINNYGIRNFDELLERVIDEKANPKKYRKPDDADLYENE